MKNTHPANRYLLGDEGYLGKRLHDQLKQMDAISEKHGWRQKAQ
ncbi:Transposase, IS4 family protein [Lactobacillus helveticus R0052]|nr:Transposase, IS4 family protein [Lactobacillus helveticus R0052]